jgi:hypothetical protein
VNPQQGKFIEEINQWRSLPLLLVPVELSDLLANSPLLPEVATIERENLVNQIDVVVISEWAAHSGRLQYLLHQLLPK